MNKELNETLAELYELMDRLEEIAEDDEKVADRVNAAINKLSEACDILED